LSVLKYSNYDALIDAYLRSFFSTASYNLYLGAEFSYMFSPI